VRAEDAAVDVCLVDDDVAEVVEHVPPAVVVGQHADVKHVRIGEDRVGETANVPAPLDLGVAVVDRGTQPFQLELGQCSSLVLRERLRRVEVERARARLGRDRAQHREVEGQRLPRRRARRDDDVPAARCGLPGFGLVAPDGGDSLPHERRDEKWVDPLGQRLRASRASLLDRAVRHLLHREQVVPRRRLRDRGHDRY
jgi:hypothetical protein